jgi:hypothetical protein
MNKYPIREYTMLAPADLLRNWRQKQPSNQGDIDFKSREESWKNTIGRRTVSDFISALQRDCCLGCVLSVTPYILLCL